ncbi:MAG: hypothetical protein PHP64_02060 [Actinomycetota bacterium]|nr:hypothetical protein [Actinomycetota bacterium]
MQRRVGYCALSRLIASLKALVEEIVYPERRIVAVCRWIIRRVFKPGGPCTHCFWGFPGSSHGCREPTFSWKGVIGIHQHDEVTV